MIQIQTVQFLFLVNMLFNLVVLYNTKESRTKKIQLFFLGANLGLLISTLK